MIPIRVYIVGACAAALVMIWGAWHTFLAAHDATKREITCADFVKNRPEEHWLKLTECEYDIDHFAYWMDDKDSEKITKVFLPLRPAGDTSGKTQLVVQRHDVEAIAIFNAIENGREPPAIMLADFRAQLEKPVEGMVLFSVQMSSDQQTKLAELDLNLAHDYAVLDNGETPPSLGVNIGLLVGGFVVGLAFLALIIREWRAEKQRPRVAVRYPTPLPQRPPVDPRNPISRFEEPL